MEQWFSNPQVLHLVVGLAIVVVFWLLTGVVRRGLTILGRRVFARTPTVLDDRVLDVVVSVIRPLMFVIGLRLAVRKIRKGAGEGDATLHQALDYAEAVLYVVAAILVVRVLLGVLRDRAYQAFLENGIPAPVPCRIVQVQGNQLSV